MKYCFLIILFCITGHAGMSQLLKKVAKGIKDEARNEVEWRARQEARRKTNQAIDTLSEKLKKKKGKKENKTEKTKETQPAPSMEVISNSAESSAPQPQEEMDMNPREGYLDARVKPLKQVQGVAVRISGETMISDKLKEVEMTIHPPGESKSIIKVPINKETGVFRFDYIPMEEGRYKVVVKSSDGKGTRNLSFDVYGTPDLQDIADLNLELLKKASDNLNEKIKALKEQTASKDDAEIDRELEKVNDKIKAAEKMLRSINDAVGRIGDAAKTKGMPPHVREELGELNELLQQQSEDMEKQLNYASHKPYDMSICEYLVILNEACAAFSTITNFWSKSIQTILKNIAIDKAIPKGAEMGNKAGGAPVPVDHDFWVKEPTKIFATAQLDAASLSTKLGKAGLAGDLLQYLSSVLLKEYCNTYSGELKFHYDVTYREDGSVWWKNGYDCGATISLRYPKSQKPQNGIIKMKGNIEGNATKFTFSHDVSKILPKNVAVLPVQSINPPAMPFVSSQADELGFGAVARGIMTPAAFHLRIDAEYNVETKSIKLFYNGATLDFLSSVRSRAFFVVLAVLPLPKYQEFPIMKMGLTFNAVLKRNNEFPMTAAGFTGKGAMHLPYPDIEHHGNFSITVKKD